MLWAGGHASPYRPHRQTIELVAGQIEEARGFGGILQRGIAKVRSKWALARAARKRLKLAAARAIV